MLNNVFKMKWHLLMVVIETWWLLCDVIDEDAALDFCTSGIAEWWKLHVFLSLPCFTHSFLILLSYLLYVEIVLRPLPELRDST